MIKFIKDLFTPKSVKLKGYARLQVKTPEGKVLYDTGFGRNVITYAGLAGFAGLGGNTGSITAPTYLAVGTNSSNSTDQSQTTLGAEITNHGLARTVATVSRSTTNQTNDTLQYDYSWTASGGSSDTVTEMGVFNAASTGTMFARKVFTGVVVASGNLLVATYKITFA